MRKLWFNILIAAALLLAACGQAQTGASTPTTEAAASPPPGGEERPTLPTQDPNAVEMSCNVVSLSPTPGPTQVSMFPPVGEGDWAKGAGDEAILTIIEYSDFQ
jgi:hypothetical protein